MAKSHIDRTKYLAEFYQDINDEIEIAIANTSDLASAYSYAQFKYEYLDKLDFDSMAIETEDLFQDRNIVLFTPEDEAPQDAEDFSYYLEGIRIKVLIDVTGDFIGNLEAIKETDTYKKMKFLFKDKDITLLALVIEAAKLYAAGTLKIFKRNLEFIPFEFHPLVEKLTTLCEDLLETNDRREVVNLSYELEDTIGTYAEKMGEQRFEWNSEEIKQANWFAGVLANMEAHWYYLTLIREEQVVKLGLTDNPNIDHRLDLYENKQSLLQEAKSMQDAGVSYTDEELKKHKK